MIKTYSELMRRKTFEDRYEYLRLDGEIGKETFGYDRYLNQLLYNTTEWKRCRRGIIVRDNGCDLGMDGFEVHARILIHHIIPLTVDDIIKRDPRIFDPENLIVTSHNTHLAIHYGSNDLLITGPNIRTANDTSPWKRNKI